MRLRCGRGSNFVGAKSEVKEALEEMDKESLKKYLSEQGCEWLFNPPHASHFGVAWERQIVQAFYRQKSVNLLLIAKEGFLTVLGPGTCPL